MGIISNILEVDQGPEEDLLLITEKQQPGSCEWLTTHTRFQQWLDGSNERGSTRPGEGSFENHNKRMFWLNGRPGTGKSVCAGHIVRYLEGRDVDCCFYFFKHSNREKSNAAELLRSLAFQMAASSSQVRRALLAMAHGNGRVSKEDHVRIWNDVFVRRLLRLDFARPQVWVIDALDECSHSGLASLMQMLSTIDGTARLQTFVTSRPGGLIERALRQDKAPVLEVQIDAENSLRDIQLFVESKWPHPENTHLISDVLSKTNGLFLWASLIMARLEEAYSIEDVEEVLRHVPSEMTGFYSRIIESLAASQSAQIALCILKWVVCSPRPMTTDEIKEALKADINKTMVAIDRQLEALCGHLVGVDKRTSRVQIIHQTVSAYLTRHPQGGDTGDPESLPSTLRIDLPEAHGRAAEICLRQLVGQDFVPPKTPKRALSVGQSRVAPFSEYARTYFAYHLARSSSASENSLRLLVDFLKTNILSWVEITARTGSISLLTRTAENLRAYLRRQTQPSPPPSCELKVVEAWINDLLHIAVEFGPNLLDSPSAVYFQVPLLCPSQSVVHQQFAKPSQRLRILGSCDEQWDDRLSCFVYSVEPRAVASCSQFLAVGLENGEIILYDSETLATTATLHHGQRVMLLDFGNISPILASCSPRNLKLWNKEQSCVWTVDLEAIPLELAFSVDDSKLFLPDREGSMSVFSIPNGSRKEHPIHSNPDADYSDDRQSQQASWVPPSVVRLSPTKGLAALLYRGSTITIWDLERGEQLDVFPKPDDDQEEYHPANPTGPQALDAAFSPSPDVDLLAVAYADGDLATLNPYTMERVRVRRAPPGGLAIHALAASPDGHALAAADAAGTVHVLDFATLRPLCRVVAAAGEEEGGGGGSVSRLVFSSGGRRVVVARGGAACEVWEPLALAGGGGGPDDDDDVDGDDGFAYVSDEAGEMASSGVATSTARAVVGGREIVAVAQTGRGDFLFCGRGDGHVDVVEVSTGTTVETLVYHAKGVGVSHLAWNDERSLLVSVDFASRFIVSQFEAPSGSKATWERTACLVDHHVSEAIKQILIAPDGSTLLISTAKLDQLRDTTDGRLLQSKPSLGLDRTWMTHPICNSQLILAHGASLHIHDWASLDRLTPPEGISLSVPSPRPSAPFPFPSPTAWFSHPGSQHLVACLPAPDDKQQQRHPALVFVDASQVHPAASGAVVEVQQARLPEAIRFALGVSGSAFYFLDARGWVCSVRPEEAADGGGGDVRPRYTRHFVVPRKWQFQSAVAEPPLLRIVARTTSVVLARRDGFIVFRGFLDFEEKVPF